MKHQLKFAEKRQKYYQSYNHSEQYPLEVLRLKMIQFYKAQIKQLQNQKLCQ